jgi:predicted transcriptional regulator
MTLQLTPALEQRLEHLASQGRRTPEELAREVISEYLEHVETLSAEVREAEEEADRAGWLTAEQVLERIENRFRKMA